MTHDSATHLVLHDAHGREAEQRTAEHGAPARPAWRRRMRRAATMPPTWAAPDADAFRALMGRLAEPVVIVTGHDAFGRPHGLTVSSFSSVSLSPPLVLFCVGASSRTWGWIAGQGRFSINVLAHHQHELATRFAAPGDRFAGVAHEYTPDGTPVLQDGLATLLCDVEDGLRAGDHDIVVGRVTGARMGVAGLPLAYHGGAFASVAPLDKASVGAST